MFIVSILFSIFSFFIDPLSGLTFIQKASLTDYQLMVDVQVSILQTFGKNLSILGFGIY